MKKGIAACLALSLIVTCLACPASADSFRALFSGGESRLYLFGTDDPRSLPIAGKHAFVVLGYALENGEMTEELKGRCDAAAAAACAFPDSIVVCSGGASGENNPEGHTEAGLMKTYLTKVRGLAPDRIFIDEQAVTTAENAVHTFAILRARHIEAMTLVTSSYHLGRSQLLYNAVNARYKQAYGYSVIMAGNFCLDCAPADDAYVADALVAMAQLAQIIRLSEE